MGQYFVPIILDDNNKMKDGTLIVVEWCEANQSWLVSARNDPNASWSHMEGDEGEFDELLSMAHDIATGG